MELIATAFAFILCVVLLRVWTSRNQPSAPVEKAQSLFNDEYDQPLVILNSPIGAVRNEPLLALIGEACEKEDIDLLLQHLRLKRKELRIERRELSLDHRAIRSRHTHAVRTQFPKVPGGGEIGRTIRIWQTAARYRRRVELAETLEPRTLAIEDIDLRIVEIEWQILVLERKRVALGYKR